MRQRVMVKDVAQDGTATVFLRRASACSADCASCEGCGGQGQTVLAKALNPIGAIKGNMVEVESQTSAVLWIVALVYLVPLLLFFALYFVGTKLFGSPALWGLGGFLLGVGIAVLYNRRVIRTAKVTYRIVCLAEF